MDRGPGNASSHILGNVLFWLGNRDPKLRAYDQENKTDDREKKKKDLVKCPAIPTGWPHVADGTPRKAAMKNGLTGPKRVSRCLEGLA